MFDAGATIPTLSPLRSAGGLIRDLWSVGNIFKYSAANTLPSRELLCRHEKYFVIPSAARDLQFGPPNVAISLCPA
jgi:hypothetical protein